MACVKKLMFLLFQINFVSSAGETVTFSRSSFFTTRENKQVKGYVVKRFDSPSLLSCNQQCMRNVWCTSANYKMASKKDGKGTCELNKHDISLIDENMIHDHGKKLGDICFRFFFSSPGPRKTTRKSQKNTKILSVSLNFALF